MNSFSSEAMQINFPREMAQYIHLTHEIFVLIYIPFMLTSFVYRGVFQRKWHKNISMNITHSGPKQLKEK